MADLVHLSVAGQIGAADPAASAPGVAVRVVDPGRLHYVSLPNGLAPNEMRGGGGGHWLWLAPDRALRAGAVEPPAGFVSDVTDGLATFEISGPRAGEIIAMGCTLDPAALASGRCAQTAFAGVKVVLYAFGSGDTVRLHAERSLAPYLLEWFTQATGALQ